MEKIYYHVSPIGDSFEVKPINSKDEVKQAIHQTAGRHMSLYHEVATVVFLLDQNINSSDFATWLGNIVYLPGLGLEKPSYIEKVILPEDQAHSASI